MFQHREIHIYYRISLFLTRLPQTQVLFPLVWVLNRQKHVNLFLHINIDHRSSSSETSEQPVRDPVAPGEDPRFLRESQT